MKEISDLVNDLDWFLANIEDGDKYNHEKPSLEDGLQFDLYFYLKNLGYQVVYELELPDLKQYLDKELNESRVFGYTKGSLRPDIVVNLGHRGFSCFELKYNESSIDECAEDLAKCRVYVKNCKDVHIAGFIHLHRCDIQFDAFEGTSCEDYNYEYNFYCYTDNPMDSNRLSKSSVAKLVRINWMNRLFELKRGGGKYADYDSFAES